MKEAGYVLAVLWKSTSSEEVALYTNGTNKNETEKLSEAEQAIYDKYNTKLSHPEQTVWDKREQVASTMKEVPADISSLLFGKFVSFQQVNYVWGRYLGYHNGDDKLELSHNFTGLRNATSYTFYLIGISDNPRFLMNRTNIS